MYVPVCVYLCVRVHGAGILCHIMSNCKCQHPHVYVCCVCVCVKKKNSKDNNIKDYQDNDGDCAVSK